MESKLHQPQAMNQNPNLEKDIFAEALELPPDQLEGFLKGACRSDEQLRQRVEDLLRVYGDATRILKTEDKRPTILDAPILEGAGTIIGRYKLLEKIGEGGFGAVYVAEQREPVKRRVALKIIKLGMDTHQVVARFEAERQALAMMDHPNIAKVLDGGATETGRPYFVMELVRGIPITQYCDENYLSADERLRLFMLVCQAIQHAHQKGIIHRDIKPSNILITVNDGAPVPKVIDFGIAKATQGELTDKTIYTQFQQFIGTPAYMSPEQVNMTSLDIDTRSDIYALGVLLYELLVGKTPFDGKELLMSGLDEMRRTIREKEPIRPSTRLSQQLLAADVRRLKSPDGSKPATEEEVRASSRRLLQTKELLHLLRGDLDWIVMKCLEKDRTRRYETANGLAADVNRFLKQEPVIARPPTVMYRFQKMARRNKLAFAAASVVLLTLIAGLSFSTWAFLRERKANASEVAQRQTAVEQRTKAEVAQAREAEQRSQADAEKLAAQRHLYVAKMNLAQQALEQNNVVRLRQLLEETQESPDRGFEWYYWQGQSHSLKTLRGHLQAVNSVAFSADGQRIVTGSVDQTAKVWEAASGRELLTLKGHSAAISSVASSPDGLLIVTGSSDQSAKVWEAASGTNLLTLQGSNGAIRSVAFSPDSQRIVTGTFDGTAKVWDATSGRELFTLEGHSAGIVSVAFSPDGQRIVTGTSDGTARVWDATSGRELFTLEGHSAGIASVAFSPDGQRIVTGSHDNTAMVWEAASGRPLLTLKGHTDRIWSVAFSPDGQWIVTGSWDHTAMVWEAPSDRELLTRTRHKAPISSVTFSRDGQRIVTGSSDQTAKVWEAASGRELRTLMGHSAGIRSVAFSPDGQRIVTGSSDQTAKVWEAVSGRELRTLEGHTGLIFSVAFSPDGQRIVTGSWDHTAKVWEAASGRELLTLTGHSAGIRSVALSPDGQRIVTGSGDQTAKVWDAASGRELLTFKRHSAQILSAAFSPDGQRIVTGSGDQTAKVWEAASGRELLTLKGHSAPIGSVAFSPDGQRIVTGSDDQTAKLWEAASGRELLTLKGHTGWIGSVAFSPDGQRILSGSADRTVKVWEAASAEQVAAWQKEEQAAVQYLAGLQRERTTEQERQRIARAGDEGAIKRWLVLAPIALATGQSSEDGLDMEQIEGEGRLRPKAGKGPAIGSGELTWQEVAQEDYVIDFNVVLGHRTAYSVAYAVCYIRSEAEQHGLRMLVGSDDEAKVYLNGKQIHKYPFQRWLLADQDLVPDITLNAGLNVLVFKVVNGIFDWKGSIRFTDAQGNPVKDIKVTLDPEAKDSP